MRSACRQSLLAEKQLPTNLYEPGDNYQCENSHVLPALIRRFHEAAEANAPTMTCWAQAPRCGGSCMWMIWVRSACLLWSAGRRGRRIRRS